MSYTIQEALAQSLEYYNDRECLEKIAVRFIDSDRFVTLEKANEMYREELPINGCWVNPFEFHYIERKGIMFPTPFFRIAWGKWKDEEFEFTDYMSQIIKG